MVHCGKVIMKQRPAYENNELTCQFLGMILSTTIGQSMTYDWIEPAISPIEYKAKSWPSLWSQRARFVWVHLPKGVTRNHTLRIHTHADGVMTLVVEHKQQ